MEHWPDGWTEIENKMFFVEKTVINLGPVGYFGQNGLYVTGAAAHIPNQRFERQGGQSPTL